MGPRSSGAESGVSRSLLTAVSVDAFLRGFCVCRASSLVSIKRVHRIQTLLFSHLALLLALHDIRRWPYLFDLSPGRVIDMANGRPHSLSTVSASGANRCHSL